MIPFDSWRTKMDSIGIRRRETLLSTVFPRHWQVVWRVRGDIDYQLILSSPDFRYPDWGDTNEISPSKIRAMFLFLEKDGTELSLTSSVVRSLRVSCILLAIVFEMLTISLALPRQSLVDIRAHFLSHDLPVASVVSNLEKHCWSIAVAYWSVAEDDSQYPLYPCDVPVRCSTTDQRDLFLRSRSRRIQQQTPGVCVEGFIACNIQRFFPNSSWANRKN